MWRTWSCRARATCRVPATVSPIKCMAMSAITPSTAGEAPTCSTAGQASTGGTGNDIFAVNSGQADGDTLADFTGNGSGAGDSLLFVGYGTAAQGATFTQIGATNQWQIHSSLGGPDEIITFLNGASVDPSDFSFA